MSTESRDISAAGAAHSILQTGMDMAEIARLAADAGTASYCRIAARRLHTAAVIVIGRLDEASSELEAEAHQLDRFLNDQGG